MVSRYFVRSFARSLHRSIDRRDAVNRGENRAITRSCPPRIRAIRATDSSPWIPIDRQGTRVCVQGSLSSIFRAFVPRSVSPRPLFAFDCDAELWAIANQDSDYSRRGEWRGEVCLFACSFFAASVHISVCAYARSPIF